MVYHSGLVANALVEDHSALAAHHPDRGDPHRLGVDSVADGKIYGEMGILEEDGLTDFGLVRCYERMRMTGRSGW